MFFYVQKYLQCHQNFGTKIFLALLALKRTKKYDHTKIRDNYLQIKLIDVVTWCKMPIIISKLDAITCDGISKLIFAHMTFLPMLLCFWLFHVIFNILKKVKLNAFYEFKWLCVTWKAHNNRLLLVHAIASNKYFCKRNDSLTQNFVIKVSTNRMEWYFKITSAPSFSLVTVLNMGTYFIEWVNRHIS